MINGNVGILGATSLVGEQLISLLRRGDKKVHAFSRMPKVTESDDLIWHQLLVSDRSQFEVIKDWLCTTPIWVLPEYFTLLESYGARRIVVLSSTSRFTKADSSDKVEKAIATRLSEGENKLMIWATTKGIDWIVLRPTLIYGHGRDKNITEIANFIRRFGFFPLLGKANGLRQPIHVDDVADACLSALDSLTVVNCAYNISGEETLPYREMVKRVFAALNHSPRLPTMPLAVFSLAVACIRFIPRYRDWSVAMAERMNNDLVFDHSNAVRDFGFSPRPFRLSPEDLPR